MGILISIVFFMVSFFILAIILLQEGKGGGLAAMGGAATDSVMGARNPLRRLTIYFFVAFIGLTVFINYYQSKLSDAEIEGGLTPEKPDVKAPATMKPVKETAGKEAKPADKTPVKPVPVTKDAAAGQDKVAKPIKAAPVKGDAAAKDKATQPIKPAPLKLGIVEDVAPEK